ncbi:hypothetical protein [Corynebacterium comes]|uniref:Secreted protein n=1 Tax=Corynebacterium comes TaxID=2675218 RepID=A0A6B8VWN1_9CORY|nr:hypothetical protein [Corynebacterium comes]QGU04117.1 hypothetical protein CETAM_04230 [Corynebacterium comes]
MTRIFALKAAAVAGAASLALALAACSPPNEQPSDLKVDTATEFNAPPAAAKTSEETSEATTSTALDGTLENDAVMVGEEPVQN